MIVSSMIFLAVVALVASAGALLVEVGLRRMGAPSRFTWLGAMALGPALLALRGASLLADGAPRPAPSWAPVLELPALALSPATPGPEEAWMQGAALALWLVSGVTLALLVVGTHRGLIRERARWENRDVLGKEVLVSTDRGPAVAGVRRPWIVLPRWVLALPEGELRMVLLHEEEHIRARDTRLLVAALALVTLTSWNPLTWWQLRRLRSAMEVDCDRRVLRRAPDRATYGASLLTVAARAAGSSLGLAAFTERSLDLKRRIISMTAKTTRWTATGGAVMVGVGVLVIFQSCGVETPVAEAPAEAPVAEPAAPALTVEQGPVFAPFTQAPRLVNEEEVQKAMEANYPPLLKEAGIGGTVGVYMFVDTTGMVKDRRIKEGSGHQPLDDAALRVVGAYRFEPARNGDKKVAVWVSLPITFTVR
jgi:TonB family protein